ncbi:MAG: AMP-binding protein [Eubacteriales bacterium]|nr:AMP-binding protein [Eubacteriales bacterium]
MMWSFERFGDAIAFLDEHGQSLSYRRLSEEGKALCQAVGERCLCFQLCSNTMGSVLGYAGLIEGGIVPALFSGEMDRELLQGLYDAYHPAYFWAPEGFAWEGCQAVYSRFGYTLLKTPFGAETKLYPELGLLLTTSGSTGSPKLVRQSYRNIRANLDSIVEYLGLTADERPITTLPMNYTYGVSIINSHLAVGATLLLTEKGIAQREFWDFFKREKATSFGGVPYTYEMLDRMRFLRMELPSLRTMTQAGGKLLPELHQKFCLWCREHGKQFIVMYGQCEATARMAYLPWEKSLEKVGAMGVAIPGGRFDLIDVNGGVIREPHVTGELKYYGENVTLGYAINGGDLIKGDERHGELETGDMAQMDEDGYYTVVGRKKRFLKLFGNRVNLDELERMLKTAYPNTDVACGGRDDHLWIFATSEALLPQMRAYLSEKTRQNLAAFHTKALPAIPKSDAGKILYRELEKYYD